MLTAEQIREQGKSLDYKEYRESILGIASDIQTEYDEPTYDALHELIDSSQWVIYTWRNIEVMRHTDNLDAWHDQGLEIGGIEHPAWHVTVAYWAMYQDVIDELGRQGVELN